MKLGGGILLWSVITVIFFRWVGAQTDADVDGGPARRRNDGPAAHWSGPLRHR